MKYIFVAGAPGSKWSSVVKNIYYSADIDQSDYRDHWTYYHDASGENQLMHLGAYFDPGMECDLPENFTELSREALEKIFNSPFESQGKKHRIIKSHIFANNIDFLKQKFPESPVVLVHRSNDSCLGWWVRCGHFDITYPDYAPYYKNLREMAVKIQEQNKGILDAWHNYLGKYVVDNQQLARALQIEPPPREYQQDYVLHDIRVKVI
jgi:hypothetical protein